MVFPTVDNDANDILKAVIGYKHEKTFETYEFKVINLKTGDMVHHKFTLAVSGDVSIDVGGNGLYFAVTQGNTLYFVMTNSRKIYRYVFQIL